MAVAYAGTIKYNLQHAIDYILNEEKTKGLTYSHACSEEFAAWEFMEVQKEFPNPLRKNLARSWMISFPNWEKDVTPELVMQFTKDFMQEVYGENFQYLIAVHQDKDHLHAHVIYNNVSHITGKSPVVDNAFIFGAKEKSDILCKKYGLSVIINDKNNRDEKNFSIEKDGKTFTKSYKTEYSKKKGEKYAESRGKSYKKTIKSTIDLAIKNSKSYEDFKKFLLDNNIEIKEGKHLAFRLKNSGQERFIRGYTIDNSSKHKDKSKYTLEGILNRIEYNNQKRKEKSYNYTKSRIINLSKNQKAIDNEAYMSWAIKQNLENISDIFIRMSELDIRNINEINVKLQKIDENTDQLYVEKNKLKSQVSVLNTWAKNLNTIKKYSKIYDEYEKSNSSKFYNKYSEEIEQYMQAYKALDDRQRNANIENLIGELDKRKSKQKSIEEKIDKLDSEKYELNQIKKSLEDFMEIDKDLDKSKPLIEQSR